MVGDDDAERRLRARLDVLLPGVAADPRLVHPVVRVVPGDQLRIEMKVLKRKSTVCKMQGIATVDGVVVAEAEVMCKLAAEAPAAT